MEERKGGGWRAESLLKRGENLRPKREAVQGKEK